MPESLSSLSADQLAEKVRGLLGVHLPPLSVYDETLGPAEAALAELQTRANQYAEDSASAGVTASSPVGGPSSSDAQVPEAETPPTDRRKVEAYDAARAVVKREGYSRAEYVLRAEAAEKERDEALREVEELGQRMYEETVPKNEANERIAHEQEQMRKLCNDQRAEDLARAEAAEARLAETQKALEAADLGLQAALAHAEGLRMDTDEDEAVRLKLIETLRLARAALTTHPEAGDG